MRNESTLEWAAHCAAGSAGKAARGSGLSGFAAAMRALASALAVAGLSVAAAGLALNRGTGGRLGRGLALMAWVFAASCVCIRLCFEKGVF